MHAPMSAIRRATDADKPFMLALAQEVYADRVESRSVAWVEWCMQSPEKLVLVGEHSFGIAWAALKYGAEMKAGMDLLCARRSGGGIMEAFRMVRQMLEWARSQGARGDFRLDADTGVDLGPFAARLGGRPSPQKWYLIPLEQ